MCRGLRLKVKGLGFTVSRPSGLALRILIADGCTRRVMLLPAIGRVYKGAQGCSGTVDVQAETLNPKP